MQLFSSTTFKKQVMSCFLLSAIFLSITVLQGVETAVVDANAIDLKLNVKKGDKLIYQDESDFAVYLDLPADFIKEMKEDPSVDAMTKELYITPAAEAITQKKPIIVFKTKAKDQMDITDVSEAKDHFNIDYSIWITQLFFQESLQGNKISYDAENPANNSVPEDLPLSFKDPKSVFPFTFKAIVDPQYRVVKFIDLSKAAERFVNNISSPFLTAEVASEIVSKVKEFTDEENKELEATAKDVFTFYPPHPMKVNESWVSSLSPQLDAELKQELAEDASEDDKFAKEIGKKLYEKLFKIKSTLVGRKNGIATVKIEMLNSDNVSFEVPGDYKIDVTGNLFDGTVDFNEANGTIVSIKNKTDLKFRMNYTGPAEQKKKFDPQFIELRFNGTVSSNLVK